MRQQLVTLAGQALAELIPKVQQRLDDLMGEAASSREMQLRRDAWMAYRKLGERWREATVQAWEQALLPAPRQKPVTSNNTLELLGTDVVENKIVASRMALDLMEKAAQEVNDLRKRLKFLSGERELNARDVVHPEVLFGALVEQWEQAGLSRESWQLVSKTVQQHFNEQLPAAYAQCNADLIEQDVLPTVDFAIPDSAGTRGGEPYASGASPGDDAAAGAAPANADGLLANTAQRRRAEDRLAELAAQASGAQALGYAGGAAGGWRGPERRRGGGIVGGVGGRAQGVLEQVGRLLGGFFHPDAPRGSYQAPSAPLMTALAQQPVVRTSNFDLPSGAGQLVVIERVVQELRQQSNALKEKADNDGEKSIIELVALMFQSILQEDRIPTGVRVWFSRLQMPVLRVALADPEFFSKLDHPARQLIDHMGSCVLGFDASGISSAALEQEIKRVVQVIEQYPETGERVFKKVYDEFQIFLKQHLTQKAATQKVVGVAQQLEQKETLTIQYTIDLRDQLKDMPVREEIREFLFKVWAEVLAVAAVRQGAQHDDTLRLKKTASNLIWAASAKPNRADRARVIATLPDLLQALRDGMALTGMAPAAMEAHQKVISDTLADAFMAKTDAIAEDRIAALANHLANLDDYISDDGVDDLPLDAQTIEDLLGIDATNLDVITGAGGTTRVIMLEWVRELALGSWYTLDHNGSVNQVQYVWRSPLQHLHLFASSVGQSYLFQSNRLGGYLQKGLLVPQEEEPLLTRATRDALGKIEANPERLLG